MSYEHRIGVLVLGKSLDRAKEKLLELSDNQGLKMIKEEKYLIVAETNLGILYVAKKFGQACHGMRADLMYVDKNATSEDSDIFQDVAEPIVDISCFRFLFPEFNPIIWF